MADSFEREFKLRLPDDGAAARLHARLAHAAGRPARQVNHFFDTPTRALRGAHVALRLRDEDGAHFLTLKGPADASVNAELATRPEEELELSPTDARVILGDERSPLEPFLQSERALSPLVQRARALTGDAPLVHLGAFENERTRIGPLAFPPGSAGPPLVFELDRTRFPGGIVEHELEVELPAGADADAVLAGLRALFAELGIPFMPAANKAARFFALLDAGH